MSEGEDEGIFALRKRGRNRSHRESEDEVESEWSGDDLDFDEDALPLAQRESQTESDQTDSESERESESGGEEEGESEEEDPFAALTFAESEGEDGRQEDEVGAEGLSADGQRMVAVSKRARVKAERVEREGGSESESDGMGREREGGEEGEWKRVLPGVGQVEWGGRKEAYYGADTQSGRMGGGRSGAEEDEHWRELRDEEAIAIQMQRDSLKRLRPSVLLSSFLSSLPCPPHSIDRPLPCLESAWVFRGV